MYGDKMSILILMLRFKMYEDTDGEIKIDMKDSFNILYVLHANKKIYIYQDIYMGSLNFRCIIGDIDVSKIF